MNTKRVLYTLVPVVAALMLGAGKPAQADSFSLYFGGPGTFFGYDSGYRSHGYRHGYRRHYYGGPYRGWSARPYWRGHRYYQPRRHHYRHYRHYRQYDHYRGHGGHGWRR